MCAGAVADELSNMQDHPSAPWLPLPKPIPITEAGQLAAQTTSGTAFVTTLQYPFGLPAEKLAPAYYAYAQCVSSDAALQHLCL